MQAEQEERVDEGDEGEEEDTTVGRVGHVVFARGASGGNDNGGGDEDEDIWDDSALIRAYEEAVAACNVKPQTTHDAQRHQRKKTVRIASSGAVAPVDSPGGGASTVPSVATRRGKPRVRVQGPPPGGYYHPTWGPPSPPPPYYPYPIAPSPGSAYYEVPGSGMVVDRPLRAGATPPGPYLVPPQGPGSTPSRPAAPIAWYEDGRQLPRQPIASPDVDVAGSTPIQGPALPHEALDDSLSNLLLSWYYSGYYTGWYQATMMERRREDGNCKGPQ